MFDQLTAAIWVAGAPIGLIGEQGLTLLDLQRVSTPETLKSKQRDRGRLGRRTLPSQGHWAGQRQRQAQITHLEIPSPLVPAGGDPRHGCPGPLTVDHKSGDVPSHHPPPAA